MTFIPKDEISALGESPGHPSRLYTCQRKTQETRALGKGVYKDCKGISGSTRAGSQNKDSMYLKEKYPTISVLFS